MQPDVRTRLPADCCAAACLHQCRRPCGQRQDQKRALTVTCASTNAAGASRAQPGSVGWTLRHRNPVQLPARALDSRPACASCSAAAAWSQSSRAWAQRSCAAKNSARAGRERRSCVNAFYRLTWGNALGARPAEQHQARPGPHHNACTQPTSMPPVNQLLCALAAPAQRCGALGLARGVARRHRARPLLLRLQLLQRRLRLLDLCGKECRGEGQPGLQR